MIIIKVVLLPFLGIVLNVEVVAMRNGIEPTHADNAIIAGSILEIIFLVRTYCEYTGSLCMPFRKLMHKLYIHFIFLLLFLFVMIWV